MTVHEFVRGGARVPFWIAGITIGMVGIAHLLARFA